MQLGFTAAVDIITEGKKCEINFKFNVNYSDWQTCANRHSCTKKICMPRACAGARGPALINRPSENGPDTNVHNKECKMQEQTNRP